MTFRRRSAAARSSWAAAAGSQPYLLPRQQRADGSSARMRSSSSATSSSSTRTQGASSTLPGRAALLAPGIFLRKFREQLRLPPDGQHRPKADSPVLGYSCAIFCSSNAVSKVISLTPTLAAYLYTYIPQRGWSMACIHVSSELVPQEALHHRSHYERHWRALEVCQHLAKVRNYDVLRRHLLSACLAHLICHV